MVQWTNPKPAPQGVEKAWGAWFNPHYGSLYDKPVRISWLDSWNLYVGQQHEEEPTAGDLGFNDNTFASQSKQEVELVIKAWEVYYVHLRELFTSRNITERGQDYNE